MLGLESRGGPEILLASYPDTKATGPSAIAIVILFYDSIIEPGLGFAMVVQKEARPVAAAVFFSYGKRAVYKFAASDLTFQTYVPTTLQCRRVLNP